ncbi:MAG: hypothetical protein Q7U53_17420 [Anaerolineaceae bacterium]|nr:hypothetical protein [Anaerolineaceae bacterium]
MRETGGNHMLTRIDVWMYVEDPMLCPYGRKVVGFQPTLHLLFIK